MRLSNIYENLVIALIILVIAVIVIVLSPILIVVVGLIYVIERFEQRRYRRFLRENEGAAFFCYTNRESSERYVEEKIISKLPGFVRVIRIAENADVLSDEQVCDKMIVYDLYKKGGFPMLAKVEDGGLVYESINPKLYRALMRGAEPVQPLTRMRRFYHELSI